MIDELMVVMIFFVIVNSKTYALCMIPSCYVLYVMVVSHTLMI